MHADPLLRRVARNAVVICALMAVAGFWLGGISAAAGVIGGGVLIGISFYALGSGATALATTIAGDTPRDHRRRMARSALLKLVGRYALLGFLAYVMIARLRLHPLGLLAGVSSVVAAAALEAARFLVKSRLF